VNSTRREALEQWLDVVSRDGHFDNVPGIRRIGW
jgi:hypothetical protein